MTTKHRSSLGTAALAFSAVFNLLQVVIDVWRGEFGVAGAQCLLLVLIAAWFYLLPKFDAWLDARLAEAIAQRQTAEAIHGEVQRKVLSGEFGFGLRVTAGPPARAH